MGVWETPALPLPATLWLRGAATKAALTEDAAFPHTPTPIHSHTAVQRAPASAGLPYGFVTLSPVTNPSVLCAKRMP